MTDPNIPVPVAAKPLRGNEYGLPRPRPVGFAFRARRTAAAVQFEAEPDPTIELDDVAAIEVSVELTPIAPVSAVPEIHGAAAVRQAPPVEVSATAVQPAADPPRDVVPSSTDDLPTIEAAAIRAAVETFGDRYVVERRIGEGGTSTVYCARDLRRERAGLASAYVALKVLRDSAGEDAGPSASLARLKSEFRLSLELQHPGIVRVFDLDCDRGRWFMAMEMLEGQTLAHRLADDVGGPLPRAEAVRILTVCAEVLAFAHQRGVIHCDLKPGNIFLTHTGDVRLLDFGAAREMHGRIVDAVTNRSATPAYASPQLLEGEDPEPRDDVFSLACVAYRLLSGRHPFDGRPSLEAREAKIVAPRVQGMTSAQWLALDGALNWSRELRPADAREFVAALFAPESHAGGWLRSTAGETLALCRRVDFMTAAAAGLGIAAFSLLWQPTARVVPPLPVQTASLPPPELSAKRAIGPRVGSEPFSLAGMPIIDAPAWTEEARRLHAQLEQQPAGAAFAVVSSSRSQVRPVAGAVKPRPQARTAEPAPKQQVGFTQRSVTVSRRSSAAALVVSRSGTAAGPLRIRWRTVGDTARAGVDYKSVDGGVANFSEHQSDTVLYVPLLTAATGEVRRDRSFVVELTAVSRDARLGAANRVTVTLHDY